MRDISAYCYSPYRQCETEGISLSLLSNKKCLKIKLVSLYYYYFSSNILSCTQVTMSFFHLLGTLFLFSFFFNNCILGITSNDWSSLWKQPAGFRRPASVPYLSAGIILQLQRWSNEGALMEPNFPFSPLSRTYCPAAHASCVHVRRRMIPSVSNLWFSVSAVALWMPWEPFHGPSFCPFST